MAVFLVMGKSADGDHQKPEKAPSVAGGAFSGSSTLVSSACDQKAIRRKRSPWWSMRLIEARSCAAYGGKTLRRQRPAAWRRRQLVGDQLCPVLHWRGPPSLLYESFISG